MDFTMPTFVESIHQPLPLFQRNPVVDYLATALTLIVIYLVRTRYHNGLHKIPGPFLASFTSLWKWDVVRREKMPFVNTKLHEKHGPLVRIGPNHISASSAESIQVVHRSKSGFTKVFALLQLSPFVLTCFSLVYMVFCSRASKAPTYITSFRPRTPSIMPHSSVLWDLCTQ